MHAPRRLEEARETCQETPLPLHNCLRVEDESLNPYRLGQKSAPDGLYPSRCVLEIEIRGLEISSLCLQCLKRVFAQIQGISKHLALLLISPALFLRYTIVNF